MLVARPDHARQGGESYPELILMGHEIIKSLRDKLVLVVNEFFQERGEAVSSDLTEAGSGIRTPVEETSVVRRRRSIEQLDSDNA
jgi:hypothetical protein